MSSTTPNLGLTKTTAAETIGQNWAASNDSGGNFDIIDTKMGAVGNQSVQAQLDALNSNTWKKENATYTPNVDANTYTTSGFYQVGITTNSPFGTSTAYGILIVFAGSSGHCQQLFIAGHNGNVYVRGRNQGTDNFSAWYKIATSIPQ